MTWHVAGLCFVLSLCSAPPAQEESSSAGQNELATGVQAQGSTPELSSPPPETARTEPQSPFAPLVGGAGDLARAPDRDNVGESARRMLVALLLVIALICVAFFVLKRLMGGTPILLDQKLGRVIGRIYLSPKAVLYLVKVGGKVLLIGTTPTTIGLIAEISSDEIVAEMKRTPPESGSARMPFAGHVSQFLSRFSGPQRTGDEEAKLEEYLRDIKGQMAKLSALIGGSEDEEQG